MGPRYAALSNELNSSTPSKSGLPASKVPRAMFHLDTNPLVSGIPTMLMDARANAPMVQGMRFASPESWLLSVLCVAA